MCIAVEPGHEQGSRCQGYDHGPQQNGHEAPEGDLGTGKPRQETEAHADDVQAGEPEHLYLAVRLDQVLRTLGVAAIGQASDGDVDTQDEADKDRECQPAEQEASIRAFRSG